MNTSTFAKMCGVEKRTLFHYDEIGLLKPAFVRENGYREYVMEQLGMMDMIKIFQACGYSLFEIKQICGAEAETKFQYAKEAVRRIDAHICQLQLMKNYLQSKQQLLEEYHAMSVENSKIYEKSIRYDKKEVDTEAHFFSFLRDGIYAMLLLDEKDDIWLCKTSEEGIYQSSGIAISFFMEIPSESPDLKPQIQRRLEQFGFCGTYPYFLESLPHFLLKSKETAVLRVTVLQEKGD